MIDILIALFIGFIGGNIFGIILIALMVACSNDSRQMEENESEEEE